MWFALASAVAALVGLGVVVLDSDSIKPKPLSASQIVVLCVATVVVGIALLHMLVPRAVNFNCNASPLIGVFISKGDFCRSAFQRVVSEASVLVAVGAGLAALLIWVLSGERRR